MARTAASRRAKLPDTYFELVRRFPLVTVHDDVHLGEAQRVIDELLQTELDAGGEAYLDVLSDLVGRYEDEHHPVPDTSPAEVLTLLLESLE